MELKQKTFNEMLAEEPEQASQSLYIKNGLIIEFKDIIEISERSYDYPDKAGVKRKIYKKVNGEEIVMPLIVHGLIRRYSKELGTKLTSVKILVEGQGKQTRYTVIPLV